MNFSQMSVSEVLKKLSVDSNFGLSDIEVKKRRMKFGKNELTHEENNGFMKKLLKQLSDFMVVTLLVAAIVSLVISYIKGSNDYIDALIILFIVILNTVIGILQESRAEKAIDSLKKLSSPHAKVFRNSRGQKINSEDLVPGDILILKTGDFVCADARIIESTGFFIEESTITGESFSIEKNESSCNSSGSISDMKNMVFSGSIVTRGHARAVVTSTGMNTEVGKIACLINSEQSFKTPLSKRLEATGKILGIFIIIVCIVVFVLGIIQNVDFMEMFMISISLAVAAIPEGLPAVVTIVLAGGVRQMAARNTIVRNLPAVETLGHTAVICSDKTGTLTMNKMKVKEIYSVKGEENLKNDFSKKILSLGMLCNNSVMIGSEVKGEPTENALFSAAMESKIDKSELNSRFKRVFEIPFTSSRKLMTTVHKVKKDKYKIITKGAADIVVKKCKWYVDNGKLAPITCDVLKKIEQITNEMSSKALRIISIAYKDTQTLEKEESSLEDDLIFCAVIGMEDPIRPEAKLAVRECKKAGIKPVIVTGDHARTAIAIGKSIDLFDDDSKFITGPEISKMTDDELYEKIDSYSIFARVSPEHKVKIVKAFQRRGCVVAMTGDGVNDAPALKSADIGCAMGKFGTDAAKSASDMVIADDNFATIVEAVKQGRGMFENIKKTIHFLISTNIGEVMVVLIAFLIKVPTPLLAVHLLWINMVTDAFPALALGVDPIDPDIMKRPPISNKENFFSGTMRYNILIEGCFIASIGFLSYTVGRVFFDLNPQDPIVGRTMAFATLGLSQLMHAFNVQSKKSLFVTGFTSNMKLVYSIFFCIFLQIASIAIPSLNGFFRTTPLNLFEWLIVFVLAASPILVSELEKHFWNSKEKHF